MARDHLRQSGYWSGTCRVNHIVVSICCVLILRRVHRDGVRSERDGLFEVVKGCLVRQQTALSTRGGYLLRESILVELLLLLLGIVLGFDIRSLVIESSTASLVLAHAHRVTTVTLAVVSRCVAVFMG